MGKIEDDIERPEQEPTWKLWQSPRFAFDLANNEFFAGIEGAEIEAPFELLPELWLEPAYGHIFTSPIIAMNRPASATEHHGTPWHACDGGGRAIDIGCALHWPKGLDHFFVSPIASAWLSIAAFRLMMAVPARLPILSSRSFEDLRQGSRASIVTMEISGNYSIPTAKVGVTLLVRWRKTLQALIIAMEDGRYRRAFGYLDGSWWAGTNAIKLVSIWTALEALLLQPHTKGIKKALAATISELLCENQSDRDQKYHRVTKLYEARCDSAHEGLSPELNPLIETIKLASAIFSVKAGLKTHEVTHI